MDRIVGITRFSFAGRCDWVSARRNRAPRDGAADSAFMAKRAALLYAPERLARRFAAFEALTLPSMAAQTDGDFRWLILCSELMPGAAVERLAALLEGVPQAELLVSAATTTEEALRPHLRALAAEAGGRPALQFRIDDDDALSRHHVARLRRLAGLLAPLPQAAISFPRGLVLRSYRGAEVRSFALHRDFIGAGAAARFDVPGRSIFSLDHFHLPRRMPALTDPGPLAYLLLRWDAADTAFAAPDEPGRALAPLTGADFASRAADAFPWFDPAAAMPFLRSEAP